MAAPRPLAAAHARGLARLLVPELMHLSPVVGLLGQSCSTLVSNLLRTAAAETGPAPAETDALARAVLPACDLARQLFTHSGVAGSPIRNTRNRSHAAFWLTPALCGHVLGLAARRASEAEVVAALRACGVESNRVRGEWTGVSLQRFKRLAQSCSAAASGVGGAPLNPGRLVMLRFLWEQAQSKRCLLDYALAIEQQLPGALSAEGRRCRDDAGFAQAWAQERFAPDDVNEDALARASSEVLASVSQPERFAHSIEALACGLSQAHSFKPAVKLQRHEYKGGKEVGDCVEVVLREVLDLVLYDPETGRFCTDRLPPSAPAPVRSFYEAVARAGDLEEDALGASRAWFALCQELPGLDYISRAPAGERYELHPGMANVCGALCRLLGLDVGGGGGGMLRMEDFCAVWNAHLDAAGSESLRLSVEERVARKKSLAEDEGRLRHVAVLRWAAAAGSSGKASAHHIEVALEPDAHLATVMHRRSAGDWLAASKPAHLDALAAHCDRALASACVAGGSDDALARSRSEVLGSLWPPLLGASLLQLHNEEDQHQQHWQRCQRRERRRSDTAVLVGVLSAPWGHDRARWQPLQHETSHANVTPAAETRAAEGRALGAIAQVAGLDSQPLLEALLPWLFRELPSETGEVALALALARGEPALERRQALERALPSSSIPSDRAARVLAVRAYLAAEPGATLAGVLSSLSARDRLRVLLGLAGTRPGLLALVCSLGGALARH
jgi:hypothetical protein